MDRYQGLEEMSEAEGYALLMEQRRWEADQSANAEYETWFFAKTLSELTPDRS